MLISVSSAETLQRILRILIQTHDWQQQPSIEVKDRNGSVMYVLTLESTIAKYFSYYLDFYHLTDDLVIDLDISLTEAIKLKLAV